MTNLDTLWDEYTEELNKYEYRSLEDSRKEWRKILRSIDKDGWLFGIEDGGEVVGFLVIGEGNLCHPACNYMVLEAFVREGHRNKGLCSEAVKEFVEKYPGIYCLDVYDDNDKGLTFWRNLFDRLGYTETLFPYIEHGLNKDISDTYYFTPKIKTLTNRINAES